VLDALAEALSGDRVLVGAGPGAATVLAAGAGLRTALHVAEAAAAMPRERARGFHRSSDIRLYGLVAQLHDDPRVQAFVESELAPVLRHPAADQLLDTLRRYVESGGNKTRTAELAHRSRAAVYKRLERLERVLGVDLDDPVSLMSLGFAVLAYDHGRRAERPGQAPFVRA
jgi:purine catabolism regulator